MIKKEMHMTRKIFWYRFWWLYLLFFLVFGILGRVMTHMPIGGSEMSFWDAVRSFFQENLGAVVVFLVSVVGSSVLGAFLFLRNIPGKTKEAVEEMLNDRLSHEATNHTETRGIVQAGRRELSGEHSKLEKNIKAHLDTLAAGVNFLKDEQNIAKGRREAAGRASPKAAAMFEGIEALFGEVKRLSDENAALRAKNNQLNKRVAELTRPAPRTKSINVPDPSKTSTGYDHDWEMG